MPILGISRGFGLQISGAGLQTERTKPQDRIGSRVRTKPSWLEPTMVADSPSAELQDGVKSAHDEDENLR